MHLGVERRQEIKVTSVVESVDTSVSPAAGGDLDKVAGSHSVPHS